MHQPPPLSNAQTSVQYPSKPIRFASSTGLGQSISFLQELIEKEPGNKALLDAYVDLCKKDADMINAQEDRRAKIMDNAANERLNLIKQDVEAYKKYSDNMLTLNKAMLEADDSPSTWGYPTPGHPFLWDRLPINVVPSSF